MRWHKYHIPLFIHQHGKIYLLLPVFDHFPATRFGYVWISDYLALDLLDWIKTMILLFHGLHLVPYPGVTVRTILKKFNVTGTVTNLPGRWPMYIFPRGNPMIPNDLLENYRGASCGHPHANKLFGRPACHFTTNVSTWSLLNTTGTLNSVLWSDETKFELFGNQRSRWVWPKNKLYGGAGGSVMLWGCFPSKGPGNLVRVHGIMNSMKYQKMFIF